MARMLVTLLVLAATGSQVTAAQQPASHDTASSPRGTGSPGVARVEMIDGGPYGMAFAPVRLSARLGDTLRFVQRGRVPHNVVFRSAPPGAELSALGSAREGPLLTHAGATYDVVLDERFQPGRYVYVCAPHEVLGMAGIVNVQPSAAPAPRD